MTRRRKIILWITGGMGVLLILLLVLILLSPRFIDLESRTLIALNDISKNIGGEVLLEGVDFHFLPRPYEVIRQVSLSIPGRATVRVKSITIYPRILPLLRGKLKISKIQLEAPDVRIELPQEGSEQVGLPTLSLDLLREKLPSVFALMVLRAPDLIVQIERGVLNLTQDNNSVFWFQSIYSHLRLPPDKLEMNLDCTSNLWESLSLGATLSTDDFEGSGRIDLAKFQPHLLTNYFLPNRPQRIMDSQLNMNLSFKTEELRELRGKVLGSLPYLMLEQEDERLTLSAKSLDSDFFFSGDNVTVSLTELDLDQPQLDLSGKFVMDRPSSSVRLDLEGKDGDVESVREVVLILLGKNDTAQDIFEIVKGGTVPQITFYTSGDSPDDLDNLENMVLQAKLLEGKISIPKDRLDIGDVQGDVLMSKGILEGMNLSGRVDNSLIQGGTLRMGLKGKVRPFYLDASIQADLAQLPPILKRFVDNKAFLRELGLIENVKGDARGKLILDGYLKSLKVRVEVSRFNLYGNYRRLPYPLEVSGGTFSYEGNQIALGNVNGHLGRSSFSQLSGRVDWGKDSLLEVTSPKVTIVADEIYPWLSSLEKLRDPLRNRTFSKGIIRLSTVDLKGPLFNPGNWKFRMAGEAENLAMNLPLLPGTVVVTRGNFEALPKSLSFTKTQAGVLDASLIVSGSLNGYLEGLQGVDLMLQGSMGPEATQWVSNLVNLPTPFRINPPLSVSKGHWVWDRSGRTSFSGNLVVKKGPTVFLDLLWDGENLVIEEMTIQDGASRASLGITLGDEEINFSFAGNLAKATLDELLVSNAFLDGWVKGDFQAHIDRDEPPRSTAKGNLEGGGLKQLWTFKIPVRIDRFALSAVEDGLRIKSALFVLDGHELLLRGNVNVSMKGFLLDMNLTADGLDWETLSKTLGIGDGEKKAGQDGGIGALPLRGTISVESKYFKFGEYTWRPAQADVSFNPDGVTVAVKEAAALCGISTQGTLSVSRQQEIRLNFEIKADNENLDPSLICLMDKERLMVGTFDLTGKVTGRGMNEESLIKSLRGSMTFNAHEGRIYRFGLLSKIFAVVNITELLRGKSLDLVEEGFGYESIQAEADIRGGTLSLKEGIIDGSSMKIAFRGDVNLVDEQVDLTVLLAPLKTVDSIVGNIPLIGRILGGSLISIPVGVTGDLSDPTVVPLSPSAVGSELLGIMKRTLELPFKIIEPILPDEQ